MKKVVALLLALMLAVSCCGCTGKEQTATNTKEDDQSLLVADTLWDAENTVLSSIKADGDKIFTVCNNQKTEKYTIYSCDSTFKNCTSVSGDLEKADQHTTLFHTLEAHEGTLYLVQNSENAERVLLCFDEEGNQKGSIPLETPKKIWAADVLDNIFVRDGKIILVSSVGIQVCDAEGHTLYEITSGAKNPFYISAVCVSEDGHIFYVSNEDKPALCCVNLADGNMMWEKSYSISAQVRNLAFSEEEQRLYVHLDHALETYDVDGEPHNDTIDLREYNAVQDEDVDFYKSICCLYVKNKEDIYYGYSSAENAHCEIVHLRLASDTEQEEHQSEVNAKEERQSLRIFFPYNDRRVADLLYSFGEEHHVNVIPEYYADTFVDFNVADYLQVVSMRILSGDCGWDVMSTELIPFQQYAAQGYFAELYELAPELHDDSIYYTNILKACEQDGGLYYMPMCIEFFSMTSNQNQSTLPSSLEELYDACTQADVALNGDKDWTFQILFRAGFSGFCSTTPGEISFSRENYMRWAELAKQFYTGDFYGESARFSLQSELSFWTENRIPADATMGLLPAADNKHHFALCKGCAVMSDSSVKEIAAELMCYLEENYRYFYSIRRDYTEFVLDQMKAESAYNLTESHEAEIERYGIVLNSIYESFDCLDAIETNIYDVLWEQSYAYCKGEITLEAAMNAAENAVMLYKQELSE